ncbi:MAG TPA: hypothetical protein VF796_23035 [Humisphaera sp.]
MPGFAARPACVAALLFGAGLAAVDAAPPARPAAPAAPTAGVPATGPALDAEIDAQLAKLVHPDFRVREAGYARLVSIGPAAEPRLRRFAADSPSVDARGRARSILAQLDRRQFRQGATPVTLKLTDATPDRAFAELGARGGIPVGPRSPNLFADGNFRPESFDLVDVPFWEAIREVCRRWSLRPQYDGGDGAPPRVLLIRDQTGEMACPVARAGPATVFLSSARLSPAAAGPGATDADLQFTFFLDPRWQVVAHPARGELSAPADANGRRVGTPRPLAIQSFREGSSSWLMSGGLDRLPADAGRLGRLGGECRVRVAEMSDPVILANPVDAPPTVLRTRGGHLLHVTSVTRHGDRYRVRAVLTRNALGDAGWRSAKEVEGVQLLDGAGRALTRVSAEVSGEDPQFAYDLAFVAKPEENPGRAVSLYWRMPLEERDVTLSFVFAEPVLGN